MSGTPHLWIQKQWTCWEKRDNRGFHHRLGYHSRCSSWWFQIFFQSSTLDMGDFMAIFKGWKSAVLDQHGHLLFGQAMAFTRSFRFRSASKNGPSLVVNEGHLQEHARQQPGDLKLRLRNPQVNAAQDHDPSANETDGSDFAIFGPSGHTKLRSRLVILSCHLRLNPAPCSGPCVM